MVIARELKIPDYYKYNKTLSDLLNSILESLQLTGDFDVGEDGIEQISFAVIVPNKENPVLAGINFDNFIYPVSVYKMYVAAEVLIR